MEKAATQSPSLRVSLITLGGGRRARVDTPWDNEPTRVQTRFNFVGAAKTEVEASLDFISENPLAFQTPTKESLELTRSTFNTDSDKNTNKICILLSDGAATTGSPIAAATALTQNGIVTHTIHFSGRSGGKEELEEIARTGGGAALNADNQTELDNAFSQILATLAVSIVE